MVTGLKWEVDQSLVTGVLPKSEYLLRKSEYGKNHLVQTA